MNDRLSPLAAAALAALGLTYIAALLVVFGALFGTRLAEHYATASEVVCPSPLSPSWYAPGGLDTTRPAPADRQQP